MTNTNPETGVRYGVISANSLDPDLVELLMYGDCAVDETYEQAFKDAESEYGAEVEALYDEAETAANETDPGMSDYDRDCFIETHVEDALARMGYCDADDLVACKLSEFAEMFQCDEPHITGKYDDIEYQVTWLGGAPLVWVLKGPIGSVRSLCSPCVPGAGDLDSGFVGGDTVPPIDFEGYECYVVPSNWLPQPQAQLAL